MTDDLVRSQANRKPRRLILQNVCMVESSRVALSSSRQTSDTRHLLCESHGGTCLLQMGCDIPRRQVIQLPNVHRQH